MSDKRTELFPEIFIAEEGGIIHMQLVVTSEPSGGEFTRFTLSCPDTVEARQQTEQALLKHGEEWCRSWQKLMSNLQQKFRTQNVPITDNTEGNDETD